jgi:hypothetical protein
MFRVDRAAPVIHYTMRAARAKLQVSDPDEFSAPTGSQSVHPRNRFTLTTTVLRVSLQAPSRVLARRSGTRPRAGVQGHSHLVDLCGLIS